MLPPEGDNVGPEILSYADVPATWGVSVQTLPDAVVVAVAPITTWRPIFGMFPRSTIFIGAWMILELAQAVTIPPWKRSPLLIVIGVFALLLACLHLIAYLRIRRRLVFTISAEDFSLAIWPPLGTPRVTQWPRASVLQAQADPDGHKLVLHFQGQDPLTIYIRPNPQATAAVAQAISQALRQASLLLTLPAAVAQSRRGNWQRTAGLCITISFALGAIALLIWGGVCRPLAMPSFLLAAIAAGLSLGTQDREFWM